MLTFSKAVIFLFNFVADYVEKKDNTPFVVSPLLKTVNCSEWSYFSKQILINIKNIVSHEKFLPNIHDNQTACGNSRQEVL